MISPVYYEQKAVVDLSPHHPPHISQNIFMLRMKGVPLTECFDEERELIRVPSTSILPRSTDPLPLLETLLVEECGGEKFSQDLCTIQYFVHRFVCIQLSTVWGS